VQTWSLYLALGSGKARLDDAIYVPPLWQGEAPMRCLAHGNYEFGMCDCGVSGGKGKDVAKKQLDMQNAMQQKAFDTQQKQFAQMSSAFSPYTSGAGMGYDPQQLALMRSQALATNARTFNSAGQQVRSALAARGSGAGNLPVGGDYTRGIAGLMGAKASDISGQLSNINLQNAQQALANRFNAGQLLSGNAAALTGAQGVAGSAGASALGDYIQAANTGFGSSFMNALGAGLGGLPSTFLGGGLGKITGGWGGATPSRG
jgi:hypothetical protein